MDIREVRTAPKRNLEREREREDYRKGDDYIIYVHES